MNFNIILSIIVFCVAHISASDSIVPDGSSLESVQQVFRRAEQSQSMEEWRRITAGVYQSVAESEHAVVEQLEVQALTEWIVSQAVESTEGSSVSGLVQLIDSANLRYLYETDQNGGIQYDEAGDTVFQDSSGWEETDRALYRGMLDEQADLLVDAWEARYRTNVDALLGLVQPGIVDRIRADVRVTPNDHLRRVERDYARLVDQAISRVAYGRLMDTYSERRKSEAQSAESVASELVRATNEGLEGVAEALGALIPDANAPADELRIDANEWQASFREQFEAGMASWERAEEQFFRERIDWEERAQMAYAEAEAQWDDALGELTAARETWVAKMQATVRKGSETWNATEKAFERDVAREMEELRNAAQAETRRLQDELETYLGVFDQAAQFLNLAARNIDYLSAQLEEEQERDRELTQKINRHLNVRQQVRYQELAHHEIVVTDEEGFVRFLGHETGAIEREFFDYNRATNRMERVVRLETDSERRRRIQDVFSENADNRSLKEGYFWSRMGADYFDKRYQSYWGWMARHKVVVAGDPEKGAPYRRKRADGTYVHWRLDLSYRSPNSILKYHTDVINERSGIRTRVRTRIRELEEQLRYWQGSDGKGGVKKQYTDLAYQVWDSVRALETDFSSDSVDYSETDRERTRLERIVAMLRTQVTVAEAVVAYAEDDSSQRPTDAETQQEYAEAQEGFSAAEEAYREALHELSLTNEEQIPEAQAALADAEAVLNSHREGLDIANEEYQTAYDTWMTRSGAVFDEVIASAQRALDSWGDSGSTDGPTRSSVYTEYAQKWELYHQAVAYEEAQEIIKDIDGEGEADDFEDLLVLQAHVEALDAFQITWDDPAVDANSVELALLSLGVSADSVPFGRFMRYAERAFDADSHTAWQALAERALDGIVSEARLKVYKAEQIKQLLTLGTVGTESPGSGATSALLMSDTKERADEAYSEFLEEWVVTERQAIDALLGVRVGTSEHAVILQEAWLSENSPPLECADRFQK